MPCVPPTPPAHASGRRGGSLLQGPRPISRIRCCHELGRRSTLFTRLRGGELLGLQRDDVDLAEGELVVRRQRVDAGGHAVTGDAKTAAGQNRPVGPGPAALAAVLTWRDARTTIVLPGRTCTRERLD